MNGKKWFPGAISLAVILIAALIGLAACTSKAPAVSGKCETASEPSAADFRQWASKDGKGHFRDGIIQFSCTLNDDRLKGDWFNTANFDGDATTYAGMYYGLWWINGPDSKPIWEGVGHGYSDPAGKFSAKFTLYGRGKYEGLQAEFKSTKAKEDKQYTLVGDIIPLEK